MISDTSLGIVASRPVRLTAVILSSFRVTTMRTPSIFSCMIQFGSAIRALAWSSSIGLRRLHIDS